VERTARGGSDTFLQGLKQATGAHATGAQQAAGAQQATGAGAGEAAGTQQAAGLQATGAHGGFSDFTTTTGSATGTDSTATFGSADVRTWGFGRKQDQGIII